MAVKQKVVLIDTLTAQTSVKELRQQLKELKDTLVSTEKGTEEYNNAMCQAADIMHTLKEQSEELNASAMDFGLIVSNSTKALGGLVGGLQAAKATLSLFGVENENILNSLKKMQDLMAITQALPAIDNGIKAFKRLALVIRTATAGVDGFKVALASTGIGAAIIALGLLIANWDKVSDAMKRWGIIHEDTTKKLEEQRKKLEELGKELKKAQQAYEDWDKNDKIGRLNKKRKEEYEMLARLIEKYELLAVAAGKARDAEGNREKWEELNKRWLELEDTVLKYKNLQREILNDEMSFIETMDPDEILKDDWLAKWKKGIEDKMMADKKPIKVPGKVVLEVEDEDISKADELRKKTMSIVEGLRNAFITPEEQYQKEINALELALKTKQIKEEEYLKLRDALNREQTEREVSRWVTAANAIGSIFTSLGDAMEEGTEEQKALQIMGATINMLAGIAAAIAGAFTTHSGPWDIALAAIQAAAIAASSGATIAKMAKTNTSNAASMASSRPSTSAITSINAPVQYTQDVQGASIESNIKDSRVYVVESDITNAQKRVAVVENEARF